MADEPETKTDAGAEATAKSGAGGHHRTPSRYRRRGQHAG